MRTTMGRRGPQPTNLSPAAAAKRQRRADLRAGALPMRATRNSGGDRAALIARNRAFAAEWKRTHPCIDCGFSDPRTLDFDHRDRAKKFHQVSFLISRCYSLDVVKAEIAKCDVRCANCHRIKTTESFDRYPLEEWER